MTSGVCTTRQIMLLLPLGDKAAETTWKPWGYPGQDHPSEATPAPLSSLSCLPVNCEDDLGVREDEPGLK